MSLISKMKKSAKKAEEEKAQIDFARRTASQRERIVEGEIRKPDGTVSKFYGREITSDGPVVHSRFFNQCSQGGIPTTSTSTTTAPNLANLRGRNSDVSTTYSQGVRPKTSTNEQAEGVSGVSSSSKENSSFRKTPNLSKLRGNTSSSFVPTTLLESSSLRSNSHTISTMPQRTVTAAVTPSLQQSSGRISIAESANMDFINLGNVIGNVFGGGQTSVGAEASSSNSLFKKPALAIEQRQLQPSHVQRQLAYNRELEGRRETSTGEQASSSSAFFDQQQMAIVQRQQQPTHAERQLALETQLRGRQETSTGGEASSSRGVCEQQQMAWAKKERQLALENQLRGRLGTSAGGKQQQMTIVQRQPQTEGSFSSSSLWASSLNNPFLDEEDRRFARELDEIERDRINMRDSVLNKYREREREREEEMKRSRENRIEGEHDSLWIYRNRLRREKEEELKKRSLRNNLKFKNNKKSKIENKRNFKNNNIRKNNENFKKSNFKLLINLEHF